MSVGLSERPNPGRSGATQRNPASRTGGITLRHRNDHVGSPWKNTHRAALALVEVGQAQPVEAAGTVARTGSPAGPPAAPRECGTASGTPDTLSSHVSRYGPLTIACDASEATVTSITRREALPGDQVERLEPVEHRLERRRLGAVDVAALAIVNDQPVTGRSGSRTRAPLVARVGRPRWQTVNGCAPSPTASRTRAASSTSRSSACRTQPAVQRRAAPELAWRRRRSRRRSARPAARRWTAAARSSCVGVGADPGRRDRRTPASGRAGAAPRRSSRRPICSATSRCSAARSVRYRRMIRCRAEDPPVVQRGVVAEARPAG